MTTSRSPSLLLPSGYRDGTQTVEVGSKLLYPLSHLAYQAPPHELPLPPSSTMQGPSLMTCAFGRYFPKP